ncbi:hypothetical protein DSM106972_078440 [Dulcicalothrix desertica PCC 7102]|uniref:DUF4340 domain-containing protein n=1 Tax=Dulcicalothrix desertica PCC 7102 TaxID=232991 RepID=A0A433UZX6_9CYAN|nr:DUF4340 domain-containing protein [Dulcicalothrix desertica]RUS99402.1 hypothetical protein DSM106972_078440 [Dulcicalothrix desertica PCC 7102]TWH50061.1 uncharacterized protein DUF4340 [Dulcicalothrix desertica PCC 7102]
MKLQRTTLVLMLLALGLGGFVYYYEILGANQRSEVSESQKRIFNFTASDIQSLTITRGSDNIILERSGTQSPPKWLLKAPQTSPASDASVSYLTDLLVKGQINRTISSQTSQLNEFGLDQPQATIEIKLKNQQTHKLILGKLDFSNNFLYAQINSSPQSERINVLLVSKDFQNAVNRDISEWTQAGDNPGQSSPLPLPTFNTSSPTPKN